MKVLFDARYIRTDYHDGISRYSTEMAHALAALRPLTFIIHDKKQLTFLPKNAPYVLIHAPTSIKEPWTAHTLNKYKPDVVYSLMQTMGSSGRNFKLILTAYDMIYYSHRTPPRQFNAAIRLGWLLYHATYWPQRLALNAADIVATISDDTKLKFQKTKLTKRPIVVAPPAPQKLELEVAAGVSKTPKNLVYMGSFMTYKNVETLIKSMRWLPGKTLHLLSRISTQRQAELAAFIPKNTEVIFHNGVSDKAYAELLNSDGVLVTASFDEGYGMPVGEALAYGVPAVVSDIPIFHEVAGEGALFFDPTKPKDLAAQVKKLDDKTTREVLIKKGTVHIAQFNWQSSARVIDAAIKTLI